jgi:glycosyltransferase involved in cell wall biosynthesis
MINSMQLVENAYLNLVDKIVVFNDLDKHYLSQFNDKVVVSPYGITDELLEKVEVSEIFNKLIFIGSESHYPNKEGLSVFLDTIYLPNKDFISWPIYITGNWSDSFKIKYNNYSRIIFTGLLKDFKDLYENAVLLTPIVSGSGLRTKILQAFLNKVPVISTKFASEGLFKNASDTNHIMFYETETDFLDLFRRIKEDSFYTKKIALSGNEYYLKNFDTETLNVIRSSIY